MLQLFSTLYLALTITRVEKVSANGKDLGWDRLLVTFGIFSPMPTKKNEAKNDGWTKDASCSGNNVFVGNRYVKGDDRSTRLIFDNDGNIAGIQATITPTATFPSRCDSSPWIVVNEKEAIVTAYFRNPKSICKKSHKKEKAQIGNELFIQVKSWLSHGKVQDKILKVPKKENDLSKPHQFWVQGKCFDGMGMHYWYNLSPQLSCNNLFPVFLMYDVTTKKLKAFGWAITSYVSSPRWLHPTKANFPFFFDLKTLPACLAAQNISTQHIYFSDPTQLTCPLTGI